MLVIDQGNAFLPASLASMSAMIWVRVSALTPLSDRLPRLPRSRYRTSVLAQGKGLRND